MLSEDRQRYVEQLFSENVVNALYRHGIILSEESVESYCEEIETAYQEHHNKIIFAKMRKDKEFLPYSWLLVDDKPYLLLHTPKSWKDKKTSNAVPKVLISLTDGGLKFLKVFRSRLLHDGYPQKRSVMEFNNLLLLGIPGIVRGTVRRPTGMKCYLVQPYHPGENIVTWMDQKQLYPRQILSILLQTSQLIFHHLHRRGFVHHDIKPANIRYDIMSDTVRLVDFETLIKIGDTTTSAFGTKGFVHPTVQQEMISRIHPITAKPSHDVYALLRTMLILLQYAVNHEKEERLKKFLAMKRQEVFDDIYDTTVYPAIYYPLEELPTMDELLSFMEKTVSGYNEIVEQLLQKNNQQKQKGSLHKNIF